MSGWSGECCEGGRKVPDGACIRACVSSCVFCVPVQSSSPLTQRARCHCILPQLQTAFTTPCQCRPLLTSHAWTPQPTSHNSATHNPQPTTARLFPYGIGSTLSPNPQPTTPPAPPACWTPSRTAARPWRWRRSGRAWQRCWAAAARAAAAQRSRTLRGPATRGTTPTATQWTWIAWWRTWRARSSSGRGVCVCVCACVCVCVCGGGVCPHLNEWRGRGRGQLAARRAFRGPAALGQ